MVGEYGLDMSSLDAPKPADDLSESKQTEAKEREGSANLDRFNYVNTMIHVGRIHQMGNFLVKPEDKRE